MNQNYPQIKATNPTTATSIITQPPPPPPTSKNPNLTELDQLSDSLSDPFKRKTRDLPNLSDCHACGLRINATNPKHRLRTLDSVWRIVLLCNKCFQLINSSQTCPYCFHHTLQNDSFCCRQCHRKIHSDCIGKFGNYAPWSYCSSRSELFSCVDCWVPKVLVNSIRVFERKEVMRKKVNLKPPLDSKVLKKKSKIAAVARAKESGLRKTMAEKRAVGLAKNDEHVEKSESLGTSSGSTDGTENRAVGDVEFAFLLHRAMNSSPRITKNSCSKNSSCLAAPKVSDGDGNLLDSRGSGNAGVSRKVEVNSNGDINVRFDGIVLGLAACGKVDGTDSCADLGKLNPKLKIYTRNRNKRRACQENSDIGMNGGVNGKGDFGDDVRAQCVLKDDGNATLRDGKCCGKPDRYLLKYARNGTKRKECQENCEMIGMVRMDEGPVEKGEPIGVGGLCLPKCDGNKTLLQDGNCNGKPDRYLLKYTSNIRRKKKKHQENGEIGVSVGIVGKIQSGDDIRAQCLRMCDGNNTVLQDDGTCNGKRDRYLLKYTTNSKKRKEFPENGEIGMAVRLGQEGKCGDDIGAQCLVTCDGNNTLLQDGKCKGKPDRYLLKYTTNIKKRKECQDICEIGLGLGFVGKGDSSDNSRAQCQLICDRNNTVMQHGMYHGKPDRYLYKYTTNGKRRKQCPENGEIDMAMGLVGKEDSGV